MGMARGRALEHAQKKFGRKWFFLKRPLIDPAQFLGVGAVSKFTKRAPVAKRGGL